MGVGIGALVTPSGVAGSGPRGVGFLPEQGWSVLQNGGDGTPARPAAAVAANVPLSPADDSEGLPYTTLRTLPPHGVVLVAGFVESESRRDERFPNRRLPLDVRDAAPFIEWGVQVRPERPLGQYQLLATVDGYAVDVSVYFGTARPSQAHFDAAQRQLDRLVVGSASAGASGPRDVRADSGLRSTAEPARVIDRTFACTVAPHAGARFITVSAVTGFRDPDTSNRWKWAAAADIEGARVNHAHALAGAPIERVTRWLSVNLATCQPTSARVALSPRGLVGGAASQLPGGSSVGSDAYRCTTSHRFLLRVRAVFRTPTTLLPQRRFGRRELTTSTAAVAKRVEFALRTDSGPLAYTDVYESGKARLFAAESCRFE